MTTLSLDEMSSRALQALGLVPDCPHRDVGRVRLPVVDAFDDVPLRGKYPSTLARRLPVTAPGPTPDQSKQTSSPSVSIVKSLST